MGDLYCCDANPPRKEKARILEAASEGEDCRCDVGVYGIYGEQADNGCLWSIVDEPVMCQPSPVAMKPRMQCIPS